MSDLLPWMAPWTGWIVSVLLLACGCALIWRGLFCDRSRGHPRCPNCWYDRTGLPTTTCPECGHTLQDPRDAWHTRRHWRIALCGIVVAFALPVFAMQRRIRQQGWGYYLRIEPLYSMFPTQVVASRSFGKFTVKILQDRRYGFNGARFENEIVRIQQGSKTELEIRNGWRCSLDTDLLDSGSPSAQDLTGDGIADVVLVQWSGGMRGSFEFYIVELGPQHARLLDTIDAGDTSEPLFRDLDHDGRIDITLNDWTFAYWKTCYAASPCAAGSPVLERVRYVANSRLIRFKITPRA